MWNERSVLRTNRQLTTLLCGKRYVGRNLHIGKLAYSLERPLGLVTSTVCNVSRRIALILLY
jgi:hypothetical protein